MSDSEIVKIVRLIRRIQRNHQTGVRLAIINGLIGRLEDHGVTESDLDRLGL